MARHALLLGVTTFKDERLATLNAPANDVEALAEVLRDPARGGFGSVVTGIDDDFLTMRDRVVTLFSNRDPDDLLLLYYSGHGVLPSNNRLFLATTETRLDMPQARSIAAAEIRDLMDQTRAARQVLVLDCCHSGAFAAGAKGAGATAVTEDTFGAGSTGRYVLTASDAQQFAWDGDRLASGNAQTRSLSHFTSWVVAGLGRGEAAPDDPDISMDALFLYIYRKAKAAGSPATPQRFVNRSSDDFVIAHNPAAATAVSIQTLATQLASDDWQQRAAAAGALALLARKPASRAAALDALAERLGTERDFKVRAVLLKALELPADKDEPSPSPAPPVPGPVPEPIPKPAQSQLDWDAMEAKAVRLSRLSFWSSWVLLPIDYSLFASRTPFDRTNENTLAGQVLVAIGLLIWSYRAKPIPAPAGIEAHTKTIRFFATRYEAVWCRYSLWVALGSGIVTLGLMGGN